MNVSEWECVSDLMISKERRVFFGLSYESEVTTTNPDPSQTNNIKVNNNNHKFYNKF